MAKPQKNPAPSTKALVQAKAKQRSPKVEAADPSTPPERLVELVAEGVALARLVAKNPGAPEGLLTELSHSPDTATRRALVMNPATPLATMEPIARQFPEELLDNPALDLFLLENPTFFRDLPVPVLRALVKRDRCPAGVLAQAAAVADELVQLGICQNASAAPDTIRALQASSWSAVSEAAAMHVTMTEPLEDWKTRIVTATMDMLRQTESQKRLWCLPFLRRAAQVRGATARSASTYPVLDEILDEAGRAYSDKAVLARLERQVITEELRLREAAAENLATPISLLVRLAGDAESSVRTRVAMNPATPIALLEQLARDADDGVRSQVAENPATPIALLERLAGDAEWRPRYKAAGNPATPIALLERLAGDEEVSVREAVAENPATPIAIKGTILAGFANQEYVWSRERAAKNPATPGTALERLAGDAEYRVREAVAKHQSAPGTALERLAGDEETYVNVRRAVAENQATPITLLEKLAGDASCWVRFAVADNQATPIAIRETILASLASYTHLDARRAVAEYSATPIALLEQLAGDEEEWIRSAVARNQAAPSAVLERLAGDASCWVREEVAKNQAAPIAIRETILANIASHENVVASRVTRWVIANDQATPIALLERLAGDADQSIRAEVAKNQSTPIALLEQLASDANEDVRIAVAGHQATPIAIKVQLLEDLASDSKKRIWQQVAENLATPSAILEAYLRDSERYADYRHILLHTLIKAATRGTTITAPPEDMMAVEARLTEDAKRFCKASVPSVPRLLALLSPWVPVPALAKYFRSTWWVERAAIAIHPATPPATRALLAEDGNAVVRAAARAMAGTAAAAT